MSHNALRLHINQNKPLVINLLFLHIYNTVELSFLLMGDFLDIRVTYYPLQNNRFVFLQQVVRLSLKCTYLYIII